MYIYKCTYFASKYGVESICFFFLKYSFWLVMDVNLFTNSSNFQWCDLHVFNAPYKTFCTKVRVFKGKKVYSLIEPFQSRWITDTSICPFKTCALSVYIFRSKTRYLHYWIIVITNISYPFVPLTSQGRSSSKVFDWNRCLK